MIKFAAATLLSLATFGCASRNYQDYDYYVLQLGEDANPEQIALSLEMGYEGPLGELREHHVFVAKKTEDDVVKRELSEMRRAKRWLEERHPWDKIVFHQKQRLREPWTKRVIPPRPRSILDSLTSTLIPKQEQPQEAAVKQRDEMAKKLEISDPIFNEQWHLFNPIQVGHDVNVSGVWMQGVTGHNVTVAIVDDGLDMYSDDLKLNYYAKGSYDFNDKQEEPKPRLADDKHGTRCAGEVAAVKNNVCGVGVAYNAKVAGLRILSKLISDADEAVALNYDFENNHIYSCSWGPPDDGRAMDAPGILIRKAMLNAIQKGRNGLGSIYVFASGNGAANDDNCNFDGYTNSIYSITIGAVDRKGQHPYYSEKCSAGLVVTYSSGSGDAIHTTDVGQNACYNGHGGTSAAAPLAAGIFALVLQVRPDLTWRDMQYLAMDTALPAGFESDDWQDTPIGKKFSHTYGYGKIDTWAMVEAAKTWKNVKPQAWFYSPWIHINQPIPQGEQGLAAGFDVTAAMLKEANLGRLEHVTVTMNVEHNRRGDISVDLISPSKIVSHLSVPRKRDDAAEGYKDWTFMSVAHWGENGAGTWTIVVRDTSVNDHNGTFIDWHLKLWGETIDASAAKLLPMPTEEDDNNHASLATTTMPAAITTLPPVPGTDNTAIAVPTDHPDRPVNNKPDENEKTSDTTWLPSFLPGFGVSASTQAWIYSSVALMAAFCSGLVIYLCMARRKRLRNRPRDDYEFELLAEETEGLTGAEKQRNRRTRGGELYDAFAGGSDDGSEASDGGEYRDCAADGHRNPPDEKRAGGGIEQGEGGLQTHRSVGYRSDDEDEHESISLHSPR